MIYVELLITFAKIGLLSFGGGYAMISVARIDVLSNAWLSPSEFVDIIAIAEMTPGPIAVNLATFVGFRTAGFLGGLVATAGVALPSFVLILLVSQLLIKYQSHSARIVIFYGIRLVVTGLIFAAAIFLAQNAVFNSFETGKIIRILLTEPLEVLNLRAILILILALIAQLKFKINPVVIIICSAIAGILLFYVL